METRKIVRANGAGVFFGEVKELNGNVAVMRNELKGVQHEGE